jgi:hypothetical protein
MLTARGAADRTWLKLRVNEEETGITPVDLNVRATLVSPPGTNFDLYVYAGTPDEAQCTAVTESSTLTQSNDIVALTWQELPFAGTNDSVWVTVRVDHVSGSCVGVQWSLTIQGNP